jgi:hypothetical protein
MNKVLNVIGTAVIVAMAIAMLSSCSRFIVDRSAGGACGVWYPRVFNPDKASRWENPRGAAGW